MQHNWSLRLDRIAEAALAIAPGEWRAGLDSLEAELEILGGLAFNYQSRPRDLSNTWLAERPGRRRVVRQISSSFWLFREVLAYGEDCVIVGPASLRSRFIEKLRLLCQQYER